MDTRTHIAAHYAAADALDRIDAALTERGVDPARLTVEDLAPYDQFHSRGILATLDVVAMAGFGPGDRILDAGGGMGQRRPHGPRI